MANKKGVIMYYDLIEQLSDFNDKDFREIITAMMEYDQTGKEPQFDGMKKVAFKFIKTTIDKNNDEYAKKCESLKQNAIKRWNQTSANGCKCMQMDANDTDIDKDIDINIKEKNIVKKEKKQFEPPTLEQVTEYAKSKGRGDLASKFLEYYTVANWVDSKGNKVKNWKQKFLTWIGRESPNVTVVADDKTVLHDRKYTKEDIEGLECDIDEIEI